MGVRGTTRRLGAATIWLLGLALIAATALPLVQTNAGWIRVLDFPRSQVAALLVLVAISAALLLRRRRPATWGLVFALLVALGLQVTRIWPYTPLHPTQAASVAACEPSRRISLVVVNLRESNRGAEAFLDVVRRVDPDLVFVVEVDSRWVDSLRPLEERYPQHYLHPRDDAWGLALYSRLPLVEPEVLHLLSDNVPSIRTGVRLENGAVVAFHGLHPRPPALSHSTAERDAELLLAAQAVREATAASIVAGDLNAVAWSDTTQLFQRIGGLLDPRIGRGLMATFHAELPALLRWPLDHIFFTADFALIEVERLPYVGSDHFPMMVTLCHAPGLELTTRHAPRPRDEDLRRAEHLIAQGRSAARRD